MYDEDSGQGVLGGSARLSIGKCIFLQGQGGRSDLG